MCVVCVRTRFVGCYRHFLAVDRSTINVFFRFVLFCYVLRGVQREKARRTMGKEAAKTKEELQATARKNEINRIKMVR